MGALAAKYGILLLGQIIDGIASLVHAHADKVPSTTPSDSPAVQIIGWVAGVIVTFIGGRLLHKAKPPAKDELVPTSTEDDPTPAGRDVGRAVGEAAARASAATRAKR